MNDPTADLRRVCISAGSRLDYLLDLEALEDKRGRNVDPDYLLDVLRVVRDELRDAAERATDATTKETV